MMLLSPGFLVTGIALAAVPIAIHLLNRRRYRIVQWAAMEYLLAAIRKNRRRLKFESWVLLAVRCAALLLLGLALSRPMGCTNSSLAGIGQRAGFNVFIIDNSYSMGYHFPRGEAKTHLDQAKVIARAMIGRMEGGGEGVAVVTAGEQAKEVIAEPTYDLQGAETTISAIAQTAAGTDLAGAMRDAIDIAQKNAGVPNKRVFILTDSTKSALEGQGKADLREAATQLSKLYRITYFNLGQREQRNVALGDLRPADRVVTTKFPVQLQANVRDFNFASNVSLQWTMDGRVLGVSESPASANGVIANFDNVAIAVGGSHVLEIKSWVDDPLAVDDACYRVITAAAAMKVLLVEGDRGSGTMGGSAGFLNIALAPGAAAGKTNDSYIEPTRISDLQLSGEVLADYRAVVLANVPSVDEKEAEALRKYVEGGGTLMIFVGELVNGENYNQQLLKLGLLPGALQRRMAAKGDSPFHFDFHPNGAVDAMLEFLRNQPRSGLETAEIGAYWQMNLPANSKADRVLNYTDGDPAITLQTVGNGRVLFFTTTADAQWTTLPAKPVYVPLMHELLRGAMVDQDEWMNLTVGQSLRVPARIKMTAVPNLTGPDGKWIELQSDSNKAGIYESTELGRPGVYTLNVGEDSYPIAVNSPTQEADVRTESPAAARAILGDVPMDFEGDQVPAEMAAVDEGKDFGWAAMLVVLGLLGAECFMAMKFGHYRPKPELLTTDGQALLKPSRQEH